jgi:O-antigen/teichoic acid export membrane protein
MTVNALSYVFHLLMTRKLGVDSYGELYSLLALMTLFSVPTTVITMVVVRYAAEFRAVGDHARLGAFASWILRRTALAAVLIIALGFVLQAPLSAYLRLTDSRSVVATAAVLALSIVCPTIRGILQGIEAFRQFAISTLIDGFGRVLFGVAFVYAGWGVHGALLGQAGAMILGLGYTWYALRSRVQRVDGPLRLDLRRLLQTSAAITTAMLALSVLGSADLLLVKHFFSPYEAGLYSAVSLVGKVLLFAIGFVPTVVLPKATARVARGESPVSVVLQAGVTIAALCTCGLGVLFLVPSFAVRVMSGTAFLGAVPYVFVYGIAMSLLGAVTVVVNYKIGLHRFDFLVPLVAVAILEPLAITLAHASLWDVVRVVLIGHLLALATSLYRLTSFGAVHLPRDTPQPSALA